MTVTTIHNVPNPGRNVKLFWGLAKNSAKLQKLSVFWDHSPSAFAAAASTRGTRKGLVR